MAKEESTAVEELRKVAQYLLAVHSLGIRGVVAQKIVSTF